MADFVAALAGEGAGRGAGGATLGRLPESASRNGLTYAALAAASISSATSSSARLNAS
jgi:hypothetical protein